VLEWHAGEQSDSLVAALLSEPGADHPERAAGKKEEIMRCLSASLVVFGQVS
jgi:hypothetical protein